ncbi:NACHT and WD repeat domain-containing protein [Streptomyces sp. 900105245]
MSRPEVRAGALKVLKDTLYGLYLDAGGPRLSDIATAMNENEDLPGLRSTDTIGRILSEPTFPQNGLDVKAVAGALAILGGGDSQEQQARIWQLWQEAGKDPRPGFVMAGPDDPQGHFTARSQGYQGRVQGSDRFRGRQAALEAVTGWLQQDQPPGRPLVITGQPGAGKSAVLTRVALDLEKTTRVPGAAVHARGLTCDTLVECVAVAAGINDSVSASELHDILKTDPGVPSRLVVALDALDEAAEGQVPRIASLLADLARLPRLRVAVATRPLTAGDRYRPETLLHQLRVTGPDSDNLVDLDTPGYLDPDGLRQFIVAILTDETTGRPSPYQAQPEVADRLAEVIAGRASSNHQQPGSNYLVAALNAAGATSHDKVLDPAVPGFDVAQIPATVDEAITKYTDGLGARKQVVMGLLTTLAYAAGSGLDQDRWLGFATALGYPVDAVAFDTLLDSPGADYLLSTTSSDGSVHYRLFHQALTDDLLARRRERGLYQRDQQRITGSLLPQSAGFPASAQDWSDIDDYTRHYLPDHAAAGGTLDRLMADPGFLLACQPERILHHRGTLSGEPRAAAAALEAAATEDWPSWSHDQRAWWLHVWARRMRAHPLADTLITGHSSWPWHADTAIRPGITVPGQQIESVNAVAVFAGADGRTRIVTGCHGALVRVWDAETGTLLHKLVGHNGAVRAVAVFAGADGRTQIVSAGDDVSAVPEWAGGTGRHASVLVWDAETGTLLQELTGHYYGVWAVAVFAGAAGPTRIVSAGRDALVRVWDAETGTALLELADHPWGAVAVAVFAEADGQPRIVSADGVGSVRVWDAETGTALQELTDRPDTEVEKAMAVAVFAGADGQTRIVSGGRYEDSVQVWDAETGALLYELTGHAYGATAVAVWAGADGRARLVSGDGRGSLRVWDPEARTLLYELTGHNHPVNAVAMFTEVHGRTRLVSASADGWVMVWARVP